MRRRVELYRAGNLIPSPRSNTQRPFPGRVDLGPAYYAGDTALFCDMARIGQMMLQRGRWQHFGLGNRSLIDVLRITWPNGIIQNETGVAANAAVGPIGEVERLEGSCPLLYTWDGTGWRFINEVLGVAPLGMPLATDVIHSADFDEYVPIPGTALRARDGMFELRLTEELREAGYLDAVRLLAVDRPAGVQTVPNERFVAPPHPEFGIYAVTAQRAVTARDQLDRD